VANKRTQTPNWQPIQMLPVIAQMIDGMLADATEHYANLEEARPKPYVLDDATVNRVIKVFTTQQDDLWVFDEQLKRWQAGSPQLTTTQASEVERLTGQMQKLRKAVTDILTLASELKGGTIEKQLAKSDLELGLEAFQKQQPRSKQP
jgi:hypothetical protein